MFSRPENGIRIIRLGTGEAVVRLYASYVETPRQTADDGVYLSANVLDIKVPDSPDLEMDVLHRFSWYYDQALQAEVEFLTGQYKKVVDGLVGMLPPGKKEAVIANADRIIREIAAGDRPYVLQRDMERILLKSI